MDRSCRLWQVRIMSRPILVRLFCILGSLLLAAGLLAWATGLDALLHPLLRLSGSGRDRDLVEGLSRLGSGAGMIPVALLAVAGAAWRRTTRDRALWLFLTILSGRLLVEGLKLVVRRERPPALDRLEWVTSWSFPSSHSAGTMMTCLAIALLCGGRRGMIGAALATAAAIGWTRLALGVHWPGDVLAGWGLGMLWVGLALRYAPTKGARSP
jgi:membrane-associated phospholipid phosphatase